MALRLNKPIVCPGVWIRCLVTLRFFSILGMLPASFLWAQNYLWPTDASKHLTSSFCEFRPRHYHAAVDIKTWNRTGYRVFAIEDGYIYRIRVSAFGYGKAIYLKIKDGNIVVYAHLERFNPRLEDYSDSLRLAAGKYVLDIYPEPHQFPVKKGDLLGYTGQTGIGVPHLHFEMRDPQNRPINPLQFYQDVYQDEFPPIAVAMALIPASTTTLINFQPDTFFLELPPVPRVIMSEPIYLSGEAYLAVRAFDRANGVSNKFDFYKARLFLNDSLLYEVKYDLFDYAQTHLIELDKSFSLIRKGMGIYHNFYRHPENRLSFYGSVPPGSGMLSANNLREGTNEVRLQIFDYAGNGCLVQFPLVYHRKIRVRSYGETVLNGNLLLGLKSKISLHHIRGNFVNRSLTGSLTVKRYELMSVKKILRDFHYFMLIPLPIEKDLPFLQLLPFYSTDCPGLPVYNSAALNLPGKDFHSYRINFHFQGSRIGLKVLGRIGKIPNVNSKSIFLYQYRPDGLYYSFPVSLVNEIDLAEVIDKGSLMEALQRWRVVIPGQEQTITSDDGLLQLHFPGNATYDTLYCAIKRVPNIPIDEAVSEQQFILPVYDVQPFDQPLRFGAILKMTLPPVWQENKGLGVYYWDRKKGWLFLPTQIDSVEHSYRARVTSLEKFTVFQDTTPPMIRPIKISRARLLRISRQPVKFLVKDELAGIYHESQISVQVDGKWILFEYDPEEDRIFIFPRHIPAGEHTLQIRAVDNVGNVVEYTTPIVK